MNKKLILIALSVVMFSTVSFAQKVIKSGDAVIIDCSNMDSKFYDSNKKPRTTDATNSSLGTNNANQISSPESNAKVYKRFEVHKTDNSTGTDWKGAVTLCANLNLNGTGWRLPTQRELILMWILKETLVANGVSPFSASYYWSATQSTTILAWVVSFDNGFTYGSNKTINTTKVRCVRDI